MGVRMLCLSALATARVIVCAAALAFSGTAAAANAIQLENAKAGTASWQLTNPAQHHEIEGYASLTSVGRGGTINLFVSGSSPFYTIDVYRLGWYGGLGARQVLGPIRKPGFVQQFPGTDADGLVDCNWIDPYVLTIPNSADATDWASGVYLAKLSAEDSGLQSYIIFTVRDDSRASDFLFQSSVNTWQAYNAWGGRSLYDYQSWPSVARKVSFNRPYDRNSGTGDFLGSNTIFGWEINMLRFLEKEGYDVTYATSVDLHEKGLSLLSTHKAFLSVGHDEYWSYQMKSAAHQARDQGRHLGFFGANAVYWQVRYEPSAKTGAASRTMVSYKEAALTDDPYAKGAASNFKYVTTRFRDLVDPPLSVVDPIGRPENGLVGVMFHSCCYTTPYDIVVSDSTSWVFAGTGVGNGTHFAGLLGYETDAIFSNTFSPPGLQKLAESADSDGYSHMTVYTAAGGGIVFATGSVQWPWGLDDFNVPNMRATVLDPKVQQTTRNVLARFALGLGVAAPTNPAAAQNGANLKVTWTQSTSAGVLSNKIYRALTAGGPYSLLATISASTSYVDNKVGKATRYYYVVTGVNGSGVESARSAEASATSK